MNVIAVTAGDPFGIGPEVTAGALGPFLDAHSDMQCIVFGDASRLASYWTSPPSRAKVIDHPVLEADQVAGEKPPNLAGGRAALSALEAAVDCVMSGEAGAIVTAPLAKNGVAKALPGFTGHTGYLLDRAGVEGVMLLEAHALRVFLVTDHLPLARVADAVTRDRLDRVLGLARDELEARLGRTPTIAVLGLNPHAGEGGELGLEEIETIEPAIAAAGGAEAGFYGPFPADSFFNPGRIDAWDGVIAMYHDQGLVGLKTLGFGAGVNVTVGLPYVRTSPDHGTAFDIAGRGIADSGSMRAALERAAETFPSS